MVMAQKRKLSDLVREETQRPEPTEPKELVTDLQTPEVVELQSTKVTDLQTSGVPKLQTPEITGSETTRTTHGGEFDASKGGASLTPPVSSEVPKYLTLVRKEVRLREDQLEQLTNLTRSLNRQRRGSGERITENTIIRVAVDLLLSQSSKLKGSNEDELSASLGLD
jgi:hypothetical protein